MFFSYGLKKKLCVKLLSVFLIFSLIFPSFSFAQLNTLNLSAPGSMVSLSKAFEPVIIKGIKLFPDNPLKFEFIVNNGNTGLQGDELRSEGDKLIKYFLASMTVPDKELWVNLSPYESDRIIPDGLGQTLMGRDMLSQDYMLKQLVSSLMFPEDEIGKKFWDRVYSKAKEKYGTTDIPLNTFNKVWIIPDKAVVYEQDNMAFVVDRHLKVMLEEDYVALQKNMGESKFGMEHLMSKDASTLNAETAEVVRQVLIPELEKEVNQGETFSNLRQIFNSLILAAWYKQNLKDSILGQIYADKNKVVGVNVDDKEISKKIYNQYLKAFKTGVFDLIKEEYDPNTQSVVPHKYFSGGVVWDPAVLTKVQGAPEQYSRSFNGPQGSQDFAMTAGLNNGDGIQQGKKYYQKYKGIRAVYPYTQDELKRFLENISEGDIEQVFMLDRTIVPLLLEAVDYINEDLRNSHEKEIPGPKSTYFVGTDDDPITYGMMTVEDKLFIQKSYYKTQLELERKNKAEHGWLQRNFILLYHPGYIQERAEKAFMFTLLKQKNISEDRIRKIFSGLMPKDVIDLLTNEILGLIIPSGDPNDRLTNFDLFISENAYLLNNFHLKGPLKVLPVDEDTTMEYAEILKTEIERAVYTTVLKSLDGNLDEEKILFFPFAAFPMTVAHLVSIILNGPVTMLADGTVVSFTEGDYRKAILLVLSTAFRISMGYGLMPLLGGKASMSPRAQNNGEERMAEVAQEIAASKGMLYKKYGYAIGMDHNQFAVRSGKFHRGNLRNIIGVTESDIVNIFSKMRELGLVEGRDNEETITEDAFKILHAKGFDLQTPMGEVVKDPNVLVKVVERITTVIDVGGDIALEPIGTGDVYWLEIAKEKYAFLLEWLLENDGYIDNRKFLVDYVKYLKDGSITIDQLQVNYPDKKHWVVPMFDTLPKMYMQRNNMRKIFDQLDLDVEILVTTRGGDRQLDSELTRKFLRYLVEIEGDPLIVRYQQGIDLKISATLGREALTAAAMGVLDPNLMWIFTLSVIEMALKGPKTYLDDRKIKIPDGVLSSEEKESIKAQRAFFHQLIRFRKPGKAELLPMSVEVLVPEEGPQVERQRLKTIHDAFQNKFQQKYGDEFTISDPLEGIELEKGSTVVTVRKKTERGPSSRLVAVYRFKVANIVDAKGNPADVVRFIQADFIQQALESDSDLYAQDMENFIKDYINALNGGRIVNFVHIGEDTSEKAMMATDYASLGREYFNDMGDYGVLAVGNTFKLADDTRDKAVLGAAISKIDPTYGGIDFDPAMLNLKVKHDGNGVILPFTKQDLENVNIEGFSPVIFEIRPIDIFPLLGINNNETRSIPTG